MEELNEAVDTLGQSSIQLQETDSVGLRFRHTANFHRLLDVFGQMPRPTRDTPTALAIYHTTFSIIHRMVWANPQVFVNASGLTARVEEVCQRHGEEIDDGIELAEQLGMMDMSEFQEAIGMITLTNATLARGPYSRWGAREEPGIDEVIRDMGPSAQRQWEAICYRLDQSAGMPASR